MSGMNQTGFESINFGTRPASAATETIVVQLDPNLMFEDWARVYANEMQRKNPIRWKVLNLTESDLFDYFTGLLQIHLENNAGKCSVWRQAHALVIPSWIQFILNEVGTVVDPKLGLKFVPELSNVEKYDINKLLEISDKLSVFKMDGVALSKDAFPRNTEGDLDVMSMAIIGSYVMSIKETAHPLSSYVAAFLGMKLKQEETYRMLYRISYDDLTFIQTMIMQEEKLRC